MLRFLEQLDDPTFFYQGRPTLSLSKIREIEQKAREEKAFQERLSRIRDTFQAQAEREKRIREAEEAKQNKFRAISKELKERHRALLKEHRAALREQEQKYRAALKEQTRDLIKKWRTEHTVDLAYGSARRQRREEQRRLREEGYGCTPEQREHLESLRRMGGSIAVWAEQKIAEQERKKLS